MFFAVCALLFVASATATILICLAMADMGEVPMAGGWSMSTAWTPLCGGSWPAAAGSFLGMWIAMTLAMMLPSLAPVLWRCREAALHSGETRAGLCAALAGLGYLGVWTALGLAVFVGGAALLEVAMRWPRLACFMPLLAAVIVIAAGAFQVSALKGDLLGCCQQIAQRGAGALAAMRQGLRLGLACCASCAGLIALLLVGGVMDLPTMAVVTAAITTERLASAGERVARACGGVILGMGAVMIVQALWLI
ncbi:hypothetical protein ASE66_31110 [Bosea sp. Root483D1]|uniref:DUF2182 domain-containing protein n=1 Tax=Bosea sp. Root483D1 TaxID=1736544 RepID=UPI00070E47F2|nr:DUF2182 domain-containing protein [Bosea sp. Root483D1]KRE17340.1 hypothetical protein ASE66_31110 [Bosea sp. Root483D1]